MKHGNVSMGTVPLNRPITPVTTGPSFSKLPTVNATKGAGKVQECKSTELLN